MMRVCPHCERLTIQSSILCERCLRGPASTGDWHTKRTYSTQVLGVVTVVLVVLATLYFSVTNALVPMLARGSAITPSSRQAAYGLIILEQVQTVFALLLLVPLSFWMWRAAKNTEAFPMADGGLKSHWAFLGWIVPVLNFSYPHRMMAQLAREERDDTSWTRLAQVWWLAVALTVIINVAELVGFLGAIPPGMRTTANPLADPIEAHVAFFNTRVFTGLMTSIFILVAGTTLCALILAIGSAQTKRVQARAARTRAAAAIPQQPAFARS